ncbi:MAG: gliding motility-associated C-terminal domain-containing protein [Flavobacteriales bacterium]|nr:gliding motility-associated C-terminal domain-containing protein [Flavobacteriales bacterium]
MISATKTFLSLAMILLSYSAISQDICHPEGNLVIFSNYDGGTLNINCDQDIPNLLIGIVSYETVTVNISGAFVGNIAGVIFGGFNEAVINGVDPSLVEIYSTTGGNIPISSYLGNDQDFLGFPLINCITSGSGCFDDTNEGGGGNSSNQIVQWFYSEFGAGTLLFSHNTQYNPWLNADDYAVSTGGNCCIELPTSLPNPIYTQGSTYDFLPDVLQLCDGPITLDLSSYPVLFQPPIYTGYVWSTGQTGPTITITEPGVYSFTVSDYCHYEESTWLTDEITILPCCDVPPSPTGSNYIACEGVDITLSVNALSGGTITWYADQALTQTLLEGLTFEPLLPEGSYTFYVTELVDNCESDPTIVTLSVVNADAPIISGVNVLCGNAQTELSSNIANVLWSIGQTSTSINVSEIGVYSASNIDINGCIAESNPFEVSAGAIPQPIISGDSVICFGGNATLTASGGQTYLWGSGETTESIVVNPIIFGLYSVTAFNGPCSASTDFLVTISAGSVGIDALPDVEIAYGDSIQIGVIASGAVNWDPFNTLSCNTCLFPWASPTQTTSYVVTSTDIESGCIFSDTITVTVNGDIQIFAPVAFTPNDDGLNDVFQIYSPNLINPLFRIFNRWGEEIFTSTDSQPIWVGGKDDYYAPLDSYNWILEYDTLEGRATKKGHVILIR